MECVFCDWLNNLHSNDKYICALNHGVLFLHSNQSYKGRCLYIYGHHVEDFMSLDARHFADYSAEVRTISLALDRLFNPALVNIAILGNQVRHLHWHIIPRYADDPNLDAPPWPNGKGISTTYNYQEMVTSIRNEIGRMEC